MPIPTYQNIYSALLTLVSDGRTRSIAQLRDELSVIFALSEDDKDQLLPSGSQKVWDSRIGWAKTYLVKAGLITQPRRGLVDIAERGRVVLKENPEVIDDKYLLRYPEFRDFFMPASAASSSQAEISLITSEKEQTPEEVIETAYQQLRQQTEAEMLERIFASSPNFFEQLVVDLLLQMGYGGSRSDAGRAIGKSGDGGIDGYIKEDKLGLETIFIQAKRQRDSVGRPTVQAFAGALQGKQARKGVLITTATFTAEARDFAGQVQTKIVLIDGKLLTRLMFEHNLGCSSQSSYELKKIDGDYFPMESDAH